MKTYSIIDASGVIVTRIVTADISTYTPPTGCSTVEETEAMGPSIIGGKYAEGVFETPTIS